MHWRDPRVSAQPWHGLSRPGSRTPRGVGSRYPLAFAQNGALGHRNQGRSINETRPDIQVRSNANNLRLQAAHCRVPS